MSVLERIDRGTYHEYVLAGTKLVGSGVTTILNDGMAKPALVQWSADQAASYAVEHHDELQALPLAKRVDKIRYAHRDTLRTASTRGTDIHSYGEKLVAGVEVQVPDPIRGPVEQYARLLDAWGIEPIAVETPLANVQYRYAGTADLWCRVGARDGCKALVDIKTGKDVYPETALQLAAYRYADLWQPNGPESESTQVPVVDRVYVAHVMPDDARMVPVVATPAEHRTFLYVQQVAKWSRSVRRDRNGYAERRLIGEAETP